MPGHPKYLRLDADVVKHEIERLLVIYPDLGEDEDLRLGAIEGETNAYEIIERALIERLDAEAMAAACHARKMQINAREERYNRKADAMKQLIKGIMKAAKLDRLTMADATLTITQPHQSVGIEDIDALPQGYFRTQRVADKIAIKKAFENGEPVPGACLMLGSEGLRINVK